jgi:4-aminobutyrate aminotransferase
MIGIELVTDRHTKARANALRNHIVQRAFEMGLLLIPCGTNSIRMTPPLNIPLPLVDEALQLFEDALTEAESNFLG